MVIPGAQAACDGFGMEKYSHSKKEFRTTKLWKLKDDKIDKVVKGLVK